MINYDIAVIGAGMAGLTAAKKLSDQGKRVIVFEKSRGTGGRLASKRIILDTSESLSFDLGCPELTFETRAFKQQLDQWLNKQVITHSRTHANHFVGQNRNSSITRHLSQSLEMLFSTRITHIEHHQGAWHIYDESNRQSTAPWAADNVIIATPPQQAIDLLPEQHALQSPLAKFNMIPQWVLVLAVKSQSELTLDNTFNHDIKSISNECIKRGEADPSDIKLYQVQAKLNWSQSAVNWGKEDVSRHLISQLKEMTNDQFEVVSQHSHRWLYSMASPTNPSVQNAFLESGDGLYLCGDYLGKVHSHYGAEAAFLSGQLLANAIPSIKKDSCPVYT